MNQFNLHCFTAGRLSLNDWPRAKSELCQNRSSMKMVVPRYFSGSQLKIIDWIANLYSNNQNYIDLRFFFLIMSDGQLWIFVNQK